MSIWVYISVVPIDSCPSISLDGTQVSTAFEESGGEGMAQGMGRDGLLNTCHNSLLFDHNEYHGAGEVGTPAVQEHIILLTGFYLHEVTVDKPFVQLPQCLG